MKPLVLAIILLIPAFSFAEDVILDVNGGRYVFLEIQLNWDTICTSEKSSAMEVTFNHATVLRFPMRGGVEAAPGISLETIKLWTPMAVAFQSLVQDYCKTNGVNK